MMPAMTVEPDPGGFRPPRFEVGVSEEAGGRVVLAISGELDLVTEPQLASALAAASPRPVTIDLSALAFMDSTGLRALLGAAGAHEGLRLRGPLEPAVQRLLELTQTLTLLPFE
jgi:anti-anti-sigma factor